MTHHPTRRDHSIPSTIHDLSRKDLPSAPIEEVDQLIDLNAVMSLVCLRKTSIYNLMRKGLFPLAFKIQSATRWSRAEVLAWRANCPRIKS